MTIRERLRALPPPRTGMAMLVMLVASGAAAVTGGPRAMVDTPTYTIWADRLIASGFDYAALAEQAGSALLATYALFVTLVAVLRLLFGEGWAAALVVLNVAAVSGVGVLMVRWCARVTGSGAAGWAALLLFAASWDVVSWVPRLGSDATFLLIAYGVFLLEAGRILRGRGRWAPVFAAAAAASLYRPTGIVLLPITGWSWFLARTRGTSARARVAVLGGLATLGAVGAAAMALVWQDPARWPFAFGRPQIADIAATYAQGQVVWDRLATYHAAPRAYGDHLLITADRLLYFFAIGSAEFSAAHLVVNGCYYGFVYLAAGWFVVQLCRGRSGLAAAERDTMFAVVGAVGAYALFHGVVQVDYDWRYRLPIMPHLVLLAAAGLGDWVKRTPSGG